MATQDAPDGSKNIKNPNFPDASQSAFTVEEALLLAGKGKFHYQLLFACGLCLLTFMSQIICAGLILPSVKCDIAATIQEQGLFNSAGFFGVVFSSHIMGFLGDTWGRSYTLKLSLGLSTLFAIISAFSVNIWMLIVTRFLTGFFASGCQACAYTFCSEFHSARTRSRHVTLIFVFLPMSLVYVPLEALLILPLPIEFDISDNFLMSTWRWLLLAINIVPIVAFLLLFFIPETPKYELVQGHPEKALAVLRRVYKLNTGRPVEEYPVKNLKEDIHGANIHNIHSVKDAFKMIWKQTAPVFHKQRILNTLNICLVLFAVFGVAHGIIMWYPTLLNDMIKRNDEKVCLVISEIDQSSSKDHNACEGAIETMMFWLMVCMGGSFSAIYLIFAFVVPYVGKKNIIIFWLCVCGAACIGVPWIANLAVAVFVLTIVGSVGNCGGLVGTIAVEYYPTEISAMSMCLTMMIGRLGAAAGSAVFGLFIFDYCDKTFWTLSALLFAIAVMSWFLPEKKIKKLKKEKQNA